jgi:uncharacterized protein YjbI with pentapeptide repeats
MKQLQVLLSLFACAALPALGELVEDPETGLRTGTITVNGVTYTIEPNANLTLFFEGFGFLYPNLSGADLSGADLSGADLSGAGLGGADLSDADLSGAGLRGADLGGADLSGADLSDANLSEAYLHDASFIGADLTNTDFTEAYTLGREPGGVAATRPIFSVITAVSRTLYKDIQALQNSQVLAGGISPEQAAAIETNSDKVGITAEQATSINSNTDEISELKTMLEAMSLQLQQLNTQVGDLQASIVAKDEQIAELSQRPAVEELLDARTGSLVFSADQQTNLVTLEFEIQESENLRDWVSRPEKVIATLPLEEGKKFIRIALRK